MMAFAVLLLTALVVARAVVALWHWVASDGGPRPNPLPPRQANWSTDLPTHPYAH